MLDTFILINAKVLDPVYQSLSTCNLLFKKGKIVGMGYLPDDKDEDQDIIDAKDAVVIPSFMELHSQQYHLYPKLEDFQVAYPTLQVHSLPIVDITSSFEQLKQLKVLGVKAIDCVVDPILGKNHDAFFKAIHSLKLNVRIRPKAKAIGDALTLEEEALWMKELIHHFSQSEGALLCVGPLRSEAACDVLAQEKEKRQDIFSFSTLAQLIAQPGSFDSLGIDSANQAVLQQALKASVIDIIQAMPFQNLVDSSVRVTAQDWNEAMLWPLFFKLWQSLGFSFLEAIQYSYINPAAFLGLQIDSVGMGASPDLLVIKENQPISHSTQAQLQRILKEETFQGACIGQVNKGCWEALS